MIAIVTDSTAYLTHDEAVRLGVVVVPMSYSFAGNQGFSEGCIENDTGAEMDPQRERGNKRRYYECPYFLTSTL